MSFLKEQCCIILQILIVSVPKGKSYDSKTAPVQAGADLVQEERFLGPHNHLARRHALLLPAADAADHLPNRYVRSSTGVLRAHQTGSSNHCKLTMLVLRIQLKFARCCNHLGKRAFQLHGLYAAESHMLLMQLQEALLPAISR